MPNLTFIIMQNTTSTLLLLALLGTTACNGQSKPEADALEPGKDTPIAEYVVECFLDSKGALWFGTIEHGVARYDGKTLTFLNPADGKGGNVVTSIAEDKDGNLWFAGHDGTGVVRYDGEHFTQLWESVSSVSTDREGNIWSSTRDSVFRYDGRTMVPFTVPMERSAITQYAILPGRASMRLHDSKGNYWFRTDGAGAFRYDGKNFTQFTKNDGLCSNTVNDIKEDDAGNIWFICMQAYQPEMTNDGGLCMWDGSRFTIFNDVNGLHHNDLYTLFKDRAGRLWVGATGVGAYRYDGMSFTLFNTTDRPDLNAIFGLQGMTEDAKGILWCGFSGGLFRLDPTEENASFQHVSREGPWE